MLNLAHLIESTARTVPGKTAVIDGEHRLSYRDLNAWANRVAGGLVDAGIRPGERVALSCPTNRHFLVCYFGILKAGAVVVPLNTLLKRDQIRSQLEFADVEACICYEGSEALPIAQEVIAAFGEVDGCRTLWVMEAQGQVAFTESVRPFTELDEGRADTFDTVLRRSDDTAIINFTSGTTGLPKAAELSHASDLLSLHPWTLVTGVRREDVVAGTIGFFTGYGRSVLLNPAFRVGGTLLLLPKFEPAAVVDAMAKHRATVFVGVPAMYHALWGLGERGERDLTALAAHWRRGVYGGAPMRARLRKAFTEGLGVQLVQGYGLTETGPIGHTPAIGAGEGAEDPLTPLWGNELRVVDESLRLVGPGEMGEVVVRGPGIMTGYYGNPAANEAVFRGGWFHTGDVARVREDGLFCLVDRLVETINRGGYKVYPAEVERILMEHPAVDRAAVKGIPDERLGQEIAAYVTMKANVDETAQGLLEWAKSRMPKYAYPRSIRIMADLPTGPTGKVIRTALPDGPLETAP